MFVERFRDPNLFVARIQKRQMRPLCVVPVETVAIRHVTPDESQ